jgi:hypothetical protein
MFVDLEAARIIAADLTGAERGLPVFGIPPAKKSIRNAVRRVPAIICLVGKEVPSVSVRMILFLPTKLSLSPLPHNHLPKAPVVPFSHPLRKSAVLNHLLPVNHTKVCKPKMKDFGLKMRIFGLKM